MKDMQKLLNIERKEHPKAFGRPSKKQSKRKMFR